MNAPPLRIHPFDAQDADAVIAFRRALLCAPAAFAQGSPAKPVHLVVPWAPGGATDLQARMLSPGLDKTLGQPIVAKRRGVVRPAGIKAE